MNFFESQDDARKKTGQLIILFVLAVIVLVVLTNLIVMLALGFMQTNTVSLSVGLEVVNAKVFWTVSAIVIMVIAGASLTRIANLSSGGEQVAQMMGGKLLSNETNAFEERQLLNVVAEMAIASGTPVPPVYLIEEQGINAFAAGFSTSDAVIGITRGAIETLNRKELQGVIAHEFSHILNGDMRLNIRLIGILYGILVIGLIGHFLLRSGAYSSYGYRRSRNNSGGAMLALGAGLIAVGYAGSFFGNMIKSAVSRQREFLADASAVQFTRDPEGIGHALMQIGASQAGSVLENPHAEEISHCLFSNGIKSSIASLFSTHPPLSLRIKRLLPSWDGTYPVARSKAQTQATGREQSASNRASSVAAVSVVSHVAGAVDIKSQAGRPTPDHVHYAKDVLQHIPEQVFAAVNLPYGARAAMYYLLLNSDPAVRRDQLDYLGKKADPSVFELTGTLYENCGDLKEQYRLPLVDLALPVLRQLSTEQYNVFRHNINMLIAVDGRQNLFEWILQRILLSHLDTVFGIKHDKQKTMRSFAEVKYACRTLLSVLVYTDHQGNSSHEEIFSRAASSLGLTIQLADEDTLSLTDLDEAVEKLRALMPLKKPQLLKACVLCITGDNIITPKEAELFRAISESLDCPMPPLLIN